MALKDNLKRLRERAGYENGKELADAIGIAYPRYMTYERGSWPNEETLTKIATQLHTSIDELLGYQPTFVDAFTRSKDFLESIVGLNIEVVDDVGGIGIFRSIGLMHVRFKSKAEFVKYVDSLIQAFEESDQYNKLLRDFVDEKLFVLDGEWVLAHLSPQYEFHPIVSGDNMQTVYEKWIEWIRAHTNASQAKDQTFTPFLGHAPFPTGKEPDKADGQHADQAKENAADPKANGDKKD